MANKNLITIMAAGMTLAGALSYLGNVDTQRTITELGLVQTESAVYTKGTDKQVNDQAVSGCDPFNNTNPTIYQSSNDQFDPNRAEIKGDTIDSVFETCDSFNSMMEMMGIGEGTEMDVYFVPVMEDTVRTNFLTRAKEIVKQKNIGNQLLLYGKKGAFGEGQVPYENLDSLSKQVIGNQVSSMKDNLNYKNSREETEYMLPFLK